LSIGIVSASEDVVYGRSKSREKRREEKRRKKITERRGVQTKKEHESKSK
jgi:hypothetical protein